MRALVTGLSGLTGKHLKPELEQHGYEVFGLTEDGARVDICDHASVLAAVEKIRPEAVFHLAAQSLASKSWQQPHSTLRINVEGTANLLEAIRLTCPAARVLLIGSSDQYGFPDGKGAPVSEQAPLSPKTPYAVSKCAQEQLGRVYAEAYGMHICFTRTFACGGAGQPKGVVLSDFAAGVAAVEAGLSEALHVGNLDSERDFTHVKDVARAYRLISEMGEAGQVYNVGSGSLHSIREVLQGYLELAKCPVPVEQSAAKQRPKDVRGMPCDHGKLTALTGWQPEYPFSSVISDELEDWRQRIQDR